MGTGFFAMGWQKKTEKIGEDFLRLRLPLGARGAGPKGLRGFERGKFRSTPYFVTTQRNPLSQLR